MLPGQNSSGAPLKWEVKPGLKPGDWTCPGCGANVYASKPGTQCFNIVFVRITPFFEPKSDGTRWFQDVRCNPDVCPCPLFSDRLTFMVVMLLMTLMVTHFIDVMTQMVLLLMMLLMSW